MARASTSLALRTVLLLTCVSLGQSPPGTQPSAARSTPALTAPGPTPTPADPTRLSQPGLYLDVPCLAATGEVFDLSLPPLDARAVHGGRVPLVVVLHRSGELFNAFLPWADQAGVAVLQVRHKSDDTAATLRDRLLVLTREVLARADVHPQLRFLVAGPGSAALAWDVARMYATPLAGLVLFDPSDEFEPLAPPIRVAAVFCNWLDPPAPIERLADSYAQAGRGMLLLPVADSAQTPADAAVDAASWLLDITKLTHPATVAEERTAARHWIDRRVESLAETTNMAERVAAARRLLLSELSASQQASVAEQWFSWSLDAAREEADLIRRHALLDELVRHRWAGLARSADIKAARRTLDELRRQREVKRDHAAREAYFKLRAMQARHAENADLLERLLGEARKLRQEHSDCTVADRLTLLARAIADDLRSVRQRNRR